MKLSFLMSSFIFFYSSLLLSTIDTSSKVYVIGISGGTGSGKSYVADKIKKTLGEEVVILSEDAYYKDLSHLDMEKRAKQNFDHPDSIDFALLKDQILQLKNYQSIQVPQYDFLSHSRKGATLEVHPKPIVVIEGILLLAIPEIRSLLDLKVFIDTDDDIRFLRRVLRDTSERGRTLDNVCHQYLKSVYPMHQCFVKPSKRFADVVIFGYSDNTIAIDLLISNLQKNTLPLAGLVQ